MSFSADVKNEMCRTPLSRECCALAEAYGALLYCHTFDHREIRVVTASSDFAERLPKLIRRAFGLEFDSRPAPGAGGKRSFIMTDAGKIDHIFAAFGYDARSIVSHHLNLGVVEEECCRAAFLRGVFLAGGSVNDPEKRCHLELVTDHLSVSREVYSLLLEMGFSPKETQRKGNYVNYFRQCEAIEDFFTMTGAPVSAMKVMSAKVEKDMRNAMNRLVNCDTANADKVVSAAQEQLDAIRELDKRIGLSELPDRLQETAFLRIANPEASLSDLAMLANPPVSKSCMSHRIHKLMELATQK